MIEKRDEAFWEAMANLAATRSIVIDRPKGKPHPHWPDLIYPLDYGYLKGTSASDSSGIDVWLGSINNKSLTGILCTFDTLKRDAEVKLLLGCSSKDVENILAFYDEGMKVLYIPNSKEQNESHSRFT